MATQRLNRCLAADRIARAHQLYSTENNAILNPTENVFFFFKTNLVII